MPSLPGLVGAAIIPGLMATDMVGVDELVAEFQQRIGLSDVDAHRAAFCALATSRGWSTARIGRYLGISRARVGQRIERLRQYVDRYGAGMPILSQLLVQAPTSNGQSTASRDLPVAFEPQAWQDKQFARGLLRQVTS